MRTIHSANQLSIYGAVSSWCKDFTGNMQGQESTGVNMSTSEENEHLSQQLYQREVGSLARSSPRTQGAAHCKRKSRIRQKSLERNVLQNW